MTSVNYAILGNLAELMISLLKAEIIRHRGSMIYNKSARPVFLNNDGAYAAS